jgi:antitoxin HicB
MKKDLEYYMACPYRIEIEPIPPTKGGGYAASVPELGRFAVCADGETIEKAVTNLEAIKRERLADYLDKGLAIPEPKAEEEPEYSGHFVVRIPKVLHRNLALSARKNGVSLNQYVSTMLASGLQEDRITTGYQSLASEIRLLRKQVCSFTYNLKTIPFDIVGLSVSRADDLETIQAA